MTMLRIMMIIGSSRVRPCGYKYGFRFRIALAAQKMAKFSIRSMVLSIADEAMDKDLETIAEKIFPKTRICRTQLDASNVREGKMRVTYNVGEEGCFDQDQCPTFRSFQMSIVRCIACRVSFMHIRILIDDFILPSIKFPENQSTDDYPLFELDLTEHCGKAPYHSHVDRADTKPSVPMNIDYHHLRRKDIRIDKKFLHSRTSLIIGFDIVGIIGIAVSQSDASRSILKNSCGWNRRRYRRDSPISTVRW